MSATDNQPTADHGSPAASSGPVQSLDQLLVAMDQRRRQPVITLHLALQQMRLMDAAMIDALEDEDPELLRSRSSELVRRVWVSADDLHHALARVAGIVEVDVIHFDVSREAFEVLPVRDCRIHDVVPLGRVEELFFVASWAPTNEDLRMTLANLTGHNVSLVWASHSAIDRRLDLEEHVLSSLPNGLTKPMVMHMSPPVRQEERDDLEPQDIDALLSQALIEVSSSPEQEQSTTLSESSGMVRMVRKMIEDAQAMGASDIHIETNPGEETTLVRFRQDGDLETYLTLPGKLRAALVSRIKVMAKLDISERRRPQDGKINFAEFGGSKLELRVVVMPTHDGLEDVVMRLLASSKPIPLSKLGLQARDEATFTRLSSHSFGLILAAGPTGSGKTTTLHSMLAEVNTGERKIWTAEDPIEITQKGLRQVQINPKIGLTFAAAMRGFLRADPDIIMIGEIRDQETAKIAIEASLTGHLVLSTLHTNSAAESVMRLLDLGMDPMNFADSLVGIVAQRLVRALCVNCAEPHRLPNDQFERLVLEYVERSILTPEQGRERLLAAADVESPDKVVVHTAKGCDKCGGKGYKGRIGIYEILENSATLRQLIQQHARPNELFDAAVGAGMRSLRHDALEKLVQGKVDVRQALAAYI